MEEGAILSSEFSRSKTILLNQIQAVSDESNPSVQDDVTALMDCVANNHTFMNTIDRRICAREILSKCNIEDCLRVLRGSALTESPIVTVLCLPGQIDGELGETLAEAQVRIYIFRLQNRFTCI